jgi:NADH-ubiquinone oxidoreductase chain 4
MCLYGAFERMPLMGALGSSSIILSAAFTIYLYNRVAFGGSYSLHLKSFTDLNKREYTMLLTLVGFIVILGIYPALILDGLHYSVSTLIYSYDAEHLILFLLITSKYKQR